MTATLELPAFCGPIDFDMNRDWPCKRLAQVYHLHSEAATIDRERKRLPRLRSEYRRRNLTRWIADAEQRLAHYVATWQLKPCTCKAPASYATLAEVPLPECTCGLG